MFLTASRCCIITPQKIVLDVGGILRQFLKICRIDHSRKQAEEIPHPMQKLLVPDARPLIPLMLRLPENALQKQFIPTIS